MQRLCKNCNSFRRSNDDTSFKCAFLKTELPGLDARPAENANCWSKRAPLTPEELSRVRSAAGRKGGRKSGYGKGRTPVSQTCLRKMDHDVLQKYAAMKKVSLAESVHRICKSLVAKYPELKTDLWQD